MHWPTAVTRTLQTIYLSGVVAVGLVLASAVQPAVAGVANLPGASDSPPSAGLTVSPLSNVVGATVTADASASVDPDATPAHEKRQQRHRRRRPVP